MFGFVDKELDAFKELLGIFFFQCKCLLMVVSFGTFLNHNQTDDLQHVADVGESDSKDFLVETLSKINIQFC